MGKTIKALFKSGDDGRLLSAIEDAVLQKWGPSTGSGMSPEIRVFMLVDAVYGTFSNGGLKAYLHENLEDIEEAVRAMETIGASESAADLRRINAVFPGGTMPEGELSTVQKEFLEHESLSLYGSDVLPELAAWVRARPKAFLDLPESELSGMFTPAPILKAPGPKSGSEEMAEWLESRGVTVDCGEAAIVSAEFSYEHCTNSDTLAALSRWVGRGSIQEIGLSDCRLGSADLGVLPSFPGLRVLDLGSARFPLGALRPLGELSSLEDLTLAGVPVSDDDLRPLGLLPNLRTLDIVSTRIRGTALALFSPLRSLTLGHSPLEDLGLPFLEHTRHLTSLSVYGSRLSGPAIERVARLPDLEELDIRDTGLGESSLEPLRHHPKLRSLCLQGMALTTAASSLIAELPALKELRIGDVEKPREMLIQLRNLRSDLKLPGLE